MTLRKWVALTTHDLNPAHEPTYSSRHFAMWGARRRAAAMNRYMGVQYWIVSHDPDGRMRSTATYLRERNKKDVGDKSKAKNITVYWSVR